MSIDFPIISWRSGSGLLNIKAISISNKKLNIVYCKCFLDHRCVMRMLRLGLKGILVMVWFLLWVLFHTGWFVITQVVVTICLLMQLGNLILQLYIWTRTSTESHTGTGKRRAPIKIVQTSLALTILSGQFFFWYLPPTFPTECGKVMFWQMCVLAHPGGYPGVPPPSQGRYPHAKVCTLLAKVGTPNEGGYPPD